MSRVAQLLTLAGAMLLALGAVPKPAKQPPRPVMPQVQSAFGQISQVNVATGKLTISARSFVGGAVKTTSQTFAISNSTPVVQGMTAQARELRTGDKVIVNYMESAQAMRHPFGDYPHLNAYGEVTKTSPLTIKVGGGVQLVLSGSSKASFVRDYKLSAKDLRPGWQVGVVSHKAGGGAVAEQIRVTSTVVPMAMPTAPKPKPKPKTRP